MSEVLQTADLESAHREIEKLRKELRKVIADTAAMREETQQKISEFTREFRVSLTTVLGFSDILSANDKLHSPEWNQIAIAGHQLVELIEKLERFACQPPTSNGKTNITEPVPASGHTVLHIEDNETNFRLAERILMDRPNIEVLWAASGTQGLELAIKHSPTLILLDLNLPDIHGNDVLVQLRNNPATEKIPVIILSADISPARIERMLQLGARDYLIKPFDIKRFLFLVDEAMYARSQIAA
jgi:CheY-like chemotaxis protein